MKLVYNDTEININKKDVNVNTLVDDIIRIVLTVCFRVDSQKDSMILKIYHNWAMEQQRGPRGLLDGDDVITKTFVRACEEGHYRQWLSPSDIMQIFSELYTATEEDDRNKRWKLQLMKKTWKWPWRTGQAKQTWYDLLRFIASITGSCSRTNLIGRRSRWYCWTVIPWTEMLTAFNPYAKKFAASWGTNFTTIPSSSSTKVTPADCTLSTISEKSWNDMGVTSNNRYLTNSWHLSTASKIRMMRRPPQRMWRRGTSAFCVGKFALR